MLRIRLSRTGRKNYPAYRIVVAEHTAPIKGKFVEIVGHYIPSRDPKVLEYDQEKIRDWISKGAQPTDTVASLLKNAGMTGLEGYIGPRDMKRKKKKEEPEEEASAPAAAPAVEDKPKEEEKSEDKPTEEAPKKEAPVAEDKPAEAEAPAKEEPKAEDAPKEEEKPEENK